MEKPRSLESLKKLRKPIRNANDTHYHSLNALERFAIWVTDNVGSMGFFFLLFLWTLIWFGWNVFAPHGFRFDPFPSFVLWLFIANVIQLFLSPLIMIGQNLQSRHAEVRAQSEFEISVKSEREIEAILEHLEYQHELITKIINK